MSQQLVNAEICNDVQQTLQVIDVKNEMGNTRLHLALFNDNRELTEILLRKGVDPTSTNNEGLTPLHIIFMKKMNGTDVTTEIFFKICDDMQQTVHVDAQDNHGDTPLHMAMAEGNIRAAEFLLRRGADPNIANAAGLTPLHEIVLRIQDDELAKKFFEVCDDLQRTVQVDVQDQLGNTPLCYALLNNLTNMAELFLSKGANPNVANNTGWTPLRSICQEKYDAGFVDDFLKHMEKYQPIEVHAQTNFDNSPLHLALINNNEKVAEWLLKKGADLHITNSKKWTPLHILCQENFNDDFLENFFEIIKEKYQLLQVDTQDEKGWTPLHLAMGSGRKKAVELLLRSGADPNITNAEGSTSLHVICKTYGDVDCLAKIFFRINYENHRSIQIDAQDKLGRTPLYLALYYNKKKVAEMLLTRGADPNLADTEELTPLHIICQKGSGDDLAEIFFKNEDIQHALQVDAKDKWGRTPLVWALENLKLNTVSELKKLGADHSNFVFSSYLAKGFSDSNNDTDKLELASSALAILESLDDREYELNRSDARTFMKMFAEQELFEKPEEFDKRLRTHKGFERRAKKIMMKPNLSLYDLIQLRPADVSKQLTLFDFIEFARTAELWRLYKGHRKVCIVHLSEIMSRTFFRAWALESFMKITKYRLPLESCKMIIDETFTNKNLYHICLAAADHTIKDGNINSDN